MTNAKVVRCVVVAVLITCGDAARILGIVPSPSYSHQVVFQPIWRELSLRGHQVTTITTDPINDPKLVNLTEIDLHFLYDAKAGHMEKIIQANPFNLLFAVTSAFEDFAHGLLSQQQVQRLIADEDAKFDVVMVELGVSSMYAFAHRFKAPLIVITSLSAPSSLRSVMGSPTHPIAYPDALLAIGDNPTLLERLQLTAVDALLQIVDFAVMTPSQQLIVDKYFGPNYPPLKEIQKSPSLVLSNSDPVFSGVRPLLPTIVEIGGGVQRTKPKPLPKKLKTILDAATNGFVYFSLGSNVKSTDLSNATLKVIVETFAELPYTVLWKYEQDDFSSKPDNLFTSKWFPQQDIFKHPNIKLFITQGGLQSMDEAVYNHIPMIGMPFMGDQSFNVRKMVSKGFGLSLDHNTLNKDEFKAAILEITSNPKYRNRIKKLANLALDQPMTSLQKAIWWTEYVIRHNGTKHIRSPALDIPAYQYYLLDVAAVLATSALVVLTLVVYTLKTLLRKIVPTKKIKQN